MPLMLPRDRWAEWLGESPVDTAALLVPPTPEWLAGMALRPVGSAVGNVRNNGPELRTAIDQPSPVPLDTLF
jgi:putative SOS response-associated peptidase YedK